MYKSVLTAAVAAMFCCAGSVIAAEEGESGHTNSEAHGAHFYIVPKLVYGMGEKVTHGVETLDGASSTGFGVDLGYSLGGPWGVEVTYNSSKGDVSDAQGVVLGHATYTGTGAFAVYTYRLPSHLGLVGKLGWVNESEEIHGSTTSDSGVGYAFSAEYGLTEKVEAVVEFEGTNIHSPKGNALMLGAKVIF